jgi:A/G-specific adenine glycosylase
MRPYLSPIIVYLIRAKIAQWPEIQLNHKSKSSPGTVERPSAGFLSRLVRALLKWYARHARDLPWRRTNDPYAIWISEIMLQQTQVKTVLPYWKRWMETLPTVSDLAQAPISQVLKLWEGLGYYSRARNLHRAAQQVMSQYGGRLPAKYEDLIGLPGIGRYTAGAIGSIAFNRPWPLVDGNVLRILTRLYGFQKDPRDKAAQEQLWGLAEKLVRMAGRNGNCPKTNCSHLNQSLMELGALICTPRQPKCAECPVARYCQARQLDIVEQLPVRRMRPKVVLENKVAFVVRRRGRFWVHQRPSSERSAGLWEFPNAKLDRARSVQVSATARHLLKCTPDSMVYLGMVRYTFTHYRICLRVYGVDLKNQSVPRLAHHHWVTRPAFTDLPFVAAHRKIIHRFLSTVESSSPPAFAPAAHSRIGMTAGLHPDRSAPAKKAR